MKMRTALAGTLLCTLAAAVPTSAAETFQIASRHLNLTSDGEALHGYLAVEIVNLSGGPATEVVISVLGLNKVTFDNRTLLVGDLAAGEPKGLLEPLSVPLPVAEIDLPEEPIAWLVEYTDAGGQRVEARVNQLVEPAK